MTYRSTQQLPSFILMGIIIALLIGLFIVFAYLLLWGAIIGGIFWLCAVIKRYFIRSSDNKKQGRVIDYDPYQ